MKRSHCRSPCFGVTEPRTERMERSDIRNIQRAAEVDRDSLSRPLEFCETRRVKRADGKPDYRPRSSPRAGVHSSRNLFKTREPFISPPLTNSSKVRLVATEIDYGIRFLPSLRSFGLRRCRNCRLEGKKSAWEKEIGRSKENRVKRTTMILGQRLVLKASPRSRATPCEDSLDLMNGTVNLTLVIVRVCIEKFDMYIMAPIDAISTT